MFVAVPFDRHYFKHAVALLDWCAELSGRLDYPAVLVTARDTPMDALDEVRQAAVGAFSDIHIIRSPNNTTGLWPQMPNLLFKAMAKYAEEKLNQPFLWLEVDCVPLVPDWCDRLGNEYAARGKPYLGFRRDIPVPHITGACAIYPPRVSRLNPESLTMRQNKFGLLSFDVVEPQKTLRHAAITPLIQHEWGSRDNPPTFPDQQSLSLLHSDAVIFHRCKDGSLTKRLRERLQPEPIKSFKLTLNGIARVLGFGGPSVALVYIHVPGDKKHRDYATAFTNSLRQFPPGYGHRTIVVCQSNPPDDFIKSAFVGFRDVTYFQHDDTGWDIGAYIAVAKTISDDIQLCCGGSTFFRKSGWLKRIVEAWQKHGPGFYGSNSAYDFTPHLNTNGFWCSPKLLRQYPRTVLSRADRYNFEHGSQAAWKLFASCGVPVKLVTWCGEYDWSEWRTPPNIFHRGTQSNCLIYWHHHLKYERSSPKEKRFTEFNSDRLTDPEYVALASTVTLVYIYPQLGVEHDNLAKRFVKSYLTFPPRYAHKTIVVANGRKPSRLALDCFRDIPCEWYEHDDSGWDIGAYQAVAPHIKTAAMCCLGGPTTIRKTGWLASLMSAWRSSGSGMYGAIGSFQYGVKHLATSGFVCPPFLIRRYPKQVLSYEDRAEFEHGNNCLTNFALSLNMPVRMVCASGVYSPPDFRKPANGLNNGDQSDLLLGYRQSDIYDTGTPEQRRTMKLRVDGKIQ